MDIDVRVSNKAHLTNYSLRIARRLFQPVRRVPSALRRYTRALIFKYVIQSTNHKTDIWLSIAPQLMVIITLFVSMHLIGVGDPILSGAILYLIMLMTLRQLVPRYHRKGISFFKKKEYAAAKEEFIKSYDFFHKNSWIDKYRYLTLLSSSRISYREMDLLNVAFCYGQIGEGNKSKEYYEKALLEFPGSEVAIASLKMFESAKKIAKVLEDQKSHMELDT